MLRILPIFILLLFPAAASAAPADIDRGFGTNGRTLLDSGGPDDVSAMAMQPDGKSVVVATTAIKGDGVVMRFDVDGSPDRSFGGGDGVALVESTGAEELNTIAVQPDGKVVAVGETSVNEDLAAYRLTAQGKPDNTFDDDGARGIDAGGDDTGYAVAIQADGRIAVAGTTYKNGNHPLVARFDTNEKPDETFGAGGWRSSPDGGELYAIAVERDASLVVVGETWSGDQDDGVVYRLPPASGNMFAPEGKVLLDLGGDEEAYALAVQRDGKLLVGGWTGIGDDPVVWRLRTDLSRDPAFGDDGATIPVGLGLGWVNGLGVQADGKIIVAGERQTSNSDVLVTRLLGDFQPQQPQPQPQPGGDPKPAPVVRCAGLEATIVGTPKRDVIRGTRRRDVIAALGGNEVVRGMGGNDVICGGAGKDRLIGGKGRDRLVGGAGRDRQTQ